MEQLGTIDRVSDDIGAGQGVVSGIRARDVSGQHTATLGPPRGASVGEMNELLVSRLQLPQNDPEGRPVQYEARLDREGRHLHASELVGDCLLPGDSIMLQPSVDAGSHRR